MISIDTKELEQMAKDLKLFTEQGYPYAVRQSLTSMAFNARTGWQDNISKDLTTRNKYTRRSVRVDMARSLMVDSMRSEVGSVADYMETVEEGGVETGKRGGNVSIPTSASAGQRGRRPPTRMPRKKHRMANIKLQGDRSKYKSTKQEIYVKVLMAARSGHSHVFLETGVTRAIYYITGVGKTGRGEIKGVRMTMVQDLSRRSVRISPHPTMLPAVRETVRVAPLLFRSSLRKQLKRNKVFGY